MPNEGLKQLAWHIIRIKEGKLKYLDRLHLTILMYCYSTKVKLNIFNRFLTKDASVFLVPLNKFL